MRWKMLRSTEETIIGKHVRILVPPTMGVDGSQFFQCLNHPTPVTDTSDTSVAQLSTAAQ